MLSITDHRGFHLTFSNGYTISVQWGPGNYCERRHEHFDAPKSTHQWDSVNAEVAIWDADGKWATRQLFNTLFDEDIGDDVVGYLDADRVAALIGKIVSLHPADNSLKDSNLPN